VHYQIRASASSFNKTDSSMLLAIAIFLIALWAIGLIAHIAGGLIHILLLIALVVFVLHFVGGSTTR